jgi:hypothetical protein
MANTLLLEVAGRNPFPCFLSLRLLQTLWHTTVTTLGVGVDSFTVALLADVHIDGWPDNDSALKWSVDSIIAKQAVMNTKFAMILGDITQGATVPTFDFAKQQFDRLQTAGIPYVPLPGNHDLWRCINYPTEQDPMIGPSPDSLLPCRVYDSVFASTYSYLESLSNAGIGSIRQWDKYGGHPWNWQTGFFHHIFGSSGSHGVPGT